MFQFFVAMAEDLQILVKFVTKLPRELKVPEAPMVRKLRYSSPPSRHAGHRNITSCRLYLSA